MKKATKMGLIILGVVGGLAIIFVLVPLIVFRVAEPKLKDRVNKVYASEAIVFEDYKASNFGIESKGKTQQRGNGALVLTAHELHFFQLIPNQDFRIPLDKIKKVETTRTHLGKTVGRKLLYVSYTADGVDDAVAFSVVDVDAWVAKLAPKPAENVR